MTPTAAEERLHQFRAAHPCRQTTVGGVTWEYIACGQGADTLLLLHGGMRIAESAFACVEAFEPYYRVIAPTYPPLWTVQEMTDGIAAILDAAAVHDPFVLGQSYGGTLAQVWVQRFPARATKLVLSGAVPLRVGLLTTSALRLYLAVVPLLPEQAARNAYKSLVGQALSVPGRDRAFWKAYLNEVFATRLTKAHVLSHFRTGQDSLQNYGFDKPGTPRWPGPVLIIRGDRDRASTAADLRALARFYPKAQTHVIAGAGHPALMEKPAEYVDVVRGFFCS